MKNTKIMAALAIFLVAVLFIGAASAAVGDIASIQLSKTTAFVGDTIEANVTLTEASSGYSFNITNGTDVIVLTISFASALSEEKTFSTTGWTAGSYTITVQNNTNPLVNKSSTLNLVAKDPAYITIADGADAFVFEKIIVFDASATKLTKYSDGASPSAVNQIAGANGQFYLTESVVNGQYGKYVIGNAAFNDATKFVYIWYPELSIQAELTDPATTWGANAGDSIDGKTINKNINVTFLLNAPKVGPTNITDRFVTGTASLSAKVVFTTPVGGKTTVFGVYDNDATANYNAIKVTAAQNIVGSAKLGADAAAGTYTAQAEFTNYKPFADNAKKSNTISFTVQSTSLTLTSGKDSVVRSNPFTTTIQGDANTVYFIYIEGTDANQPYLLPGQSGYQSSSTYVNTSSTYKMPWIPTNGGTTPLSPALNDNEVIVGSQTYYSFGYFTTDASGKRTIQFNTQDNTDGKTYTVRVITIAGTSPSFTKGDDYDTVKVKVEKGSVTISASGNGSYYIGDEIKLTGTNTDSSYVFLFITGPNLDYSDGVILKALPDQYAAYNATNPVDVKTDNTWEFKWDTSNIALDTGAYTIYATSKLTNGKAYSPMELSATQNAKYETFGTYNEKDGKYYAVKLSDSEYATVSVSLKQPFLSAVPSGTIVAKGDKIYVRGTAEGNPNSLNLYMFGPNYYEKYSVSVDSDGSYEKEIEIPSSLASNQYFVVVQHPMYNGQFDAYEENGVFKIRAATTGGSEQGSFVVKGDNKLQGSQAADALTKMIDDTNIDDIYTKLTFNVEEAWIRINTVDATNWKLDEYTVIASGIEADVSTTTNFNLVEKVVTTTPTTAVPTGATPTATTAKPTETPKTPGFGAFIALAGLGAVALLVLRRN